jgi:hypothetical protein
LTNPHNMSWLSLCYATGHRTFGTAINAPGEWHIDVRAEGGGTYTRARVVVTFHPRDVSLRLVPQPPGLSEPA